MNLVVIRALAIPPKYINSEPYAQTSPIGARKTIMDGTTTFGSASDGSVDLVGCVHSDEPFRVACFATSAHFDNRNFWMPECREKNANFVY